MSSFDSWLVHFLDNPLNIAGLLALAGLFALALVFRHEVFYITRFIVKSLRRNLLRTCLTGVATMVLVFVVTMIWTVLYFLEVVTTEKSKDIKAIITERWQIPSQMPYSYAYSLRQGGYVKEGDFRVDPENDSMSWSFYAGYIEKDTTRQTRDKLIFFFCMDPSTFPKMMDGLDELTPAEMDQLNWACAEMKKDVRNVIVGRDRLKAMNKQVGDTITVYGTNYKDINIECKILASFPDGPYNQNAVMNYDLLWNSLEAYKKDHQNVAHSLAEKTLNLVWIRVPDRKTFDQVTRQITESGKYTKPAVKCETFSSGMGAFLDAYRDLLWGMKYLLVPAILATMALVIANAISISVRERRAEMAVLKVLGFGPTQVMIMVLGEAVLIGAGSGLLSAALTYLVVNYCGGIPFRIAFFPPFRIPLDAFWWGPALGGLTALIGSLAPAWSARTVKVSEVFSKVA
jgi:putative ABC transport system permease protein